MGKQHSPSRFLIMGVVNVTPDSFSDGGKAFGVEAARDSALRLMADGADLIDFGAESTRPGAKPVPVDMELQRLIPVLEAMKSEIPLEKISVDSRKDKVFAEAARSGVRWFNRVGDLPDPALMRELAGLGDTAHLAMTHMHGAPETMQDFPLGAGEVVGVVERFFQEVHDATCAAGFRAGQIWMDPGVGFGKSLAANLELLGNIRTWAGDYNVMIGVSRKSFLGRLFGIDRPLDRDQPGKAIEAMCALAGARIIRTHDVQGLAVIRNRMMEAN